MATSDSPLSVPNVTLAVARNAVVSGSASGVTGAIVEGQPITVSPLSGESFGAGPSNEFHLDSAGKTAGTNLQDGDQDIGTFLSLGGVWESGGRNGRPKLRLNNPESRFKLTTTPTTEMFISCSFYIGADITSFSSSFKPIWIMDGNDGFGDNTKMDLVMLSKNNLTSRMQFFGNAIGTIAESGSGWINGFEWFHFSGWIKDNGASEMGLLLQIVNSAGVQRKTAPSEAGQLLLQARDIISTSFNQVNIIGDSNDQGGASSVDLFGDNFYVAVGSNTRARIEIGDAELYDNCTSLYPCTISDWVTDGDVTAIPRHPEPIGKYLHIHNGNGDHVAAGTGRLIS